MIMKNIKLLFVVLSSIISVVYSRNTNFNKCIFKDFIKKPFVYKKVGRQKLFYTIDNYVYIPYTRIIDWQKSLKQIDEPINPTPDKTYYVETCKISDNKKNGAFSIIYCKVTLDDNKRKYVLKEVVEVLGGKYLNDKYDGIITSITDVGLINPKDGYINIEYKKGLILDQTIQYPEKVTCANGNTIQPFIKFSNGFLNEVLSVDNKNKLPYNYQFDGKKAVLKRYVKKPSCFENNNKASSDEYLWTNSEIINNFFSVKGAKFGYKNLCEFFVCSFDSVHNDFLIDGEYKLYNIPDKLFDTTATSSNLTATFFFKNGKKEGMAEIKSLQKHYEINGKKFKHPSLPKIRLNYKNNLLNGKCEMYFEDGKLSVEAFFHNGLVTGIAKSYANPVVEKYIDLEPIVGLPEALAAKIFYKMNISPSDVEQEAIVNIDQIISEKTSLKYLDTDKNKTEEEYFLSSAKKYFYNFYYSNFLTTINNKGGSVNSFNEYQNYCIVNYRIDSIKIKNSNYFLSSSEKDSIYVKFSIATEKKILLDNSKSSVNYTYNRNKVNNYTWFNKYIQDISFIDQNDKVVYTLGMYKNQIAAENEVRRKELEALNNTIVNCGWCGSSFKYGNGSIINVASCINDNGQTTTISTLFYCNKYYNKAFCSNKCSSQAEEDCCRINGKHFRK
jgi:hypothetical protein